MSAQASTQVTAVGFREYGPPEVLGLLPVAVPAPGPGQVRVRTVATPISPADVWFRQGGVARLIREGEPPFVPGLEIAGVIESVGDGVDLPVGASVMGVTSFIPDGRGCQSELAVLEAGDTAPIPAHLSAAEAATFPMNALTALAAVDAADDGVGEVIVVGAAGSVGQLVVQLAATRGLRVSAVASARDEAIVRRLGAADIAAKDAPLPARGRSPRRIVDCAGVGESFVEELAHDDLLVRLRPLAPESGRVLEERGARSTLVSVRAYQQDPRHLAGLADALAARRLSTRPVELIPLGAASDAHRRMEAGGVRTRLVLDWRGDRTP